MGGKKKFSSISKNRKGGKPNFRNSKINRKPKKSHNKGEKRSFNRYMDKSNVERDLARKKQIEEKMQECVSSESEEEAPDPMQQLLSTFSAAQDNKSDESDVDESEEEMEVEDGSDNIEEDPELTEEGLERGIAKETEIIEEDLPKEETIDEREEDVEAEKNDLSTVNDDPFERHLRYDMDDHLSHSVTSLPQIVGTQTLQWPHLGRLTVQIPKSDKSDDDKAKSKVSLLETQTYTQPGTAPNKITSVNWEKFFVKQQIHNNINLANKSNLLRRDCDLSDQLTGLQKELFSIINNYQDLYYPQRSFTNAEEIRFTYCLHAINHVLKTRTKILHHNAKLYKKEDLSDECRDQGLVRPKILILVPFRDSVYRIVKILTDLLVSGNSAQVINKNRFETDFTGSELSMPKKNPKPEDYELTFAGNSDDTFRMGLSVTKKSLKLFTEFYSSDIIIASPLGLRVIIGAEGEEERDFDFLSSIELLILDQADVFLMQNWDHLLHIFDHMHLQPKNTHGTDFSRLRSWVVNGWAKYYRQTLLFSSVNLPEINALLNKKCHNYAGKVKINNPIESGSIRQVALQLPQVFRRIEVKDPISALDTRFDYFINEVLPQYKDTIMSHTLIYVPSYFDYVKIRNYFKKEEVSFVQICEYSKEAKIARARDMFFHTDAHFMLYSERFHFFRRMRIKGIRHIVFYQPPVYPHFYSELCNLMQEGNQNKYGGSESNMTITVLYTKYDLQQLSGVISAETTAKIAQSDKNVHMFMTGE